MIRAAASPGVVPLLWGCLALLFVLLLLLTGYLIWQARRATRRPVAPEATDAAVSEKADVNPALAAELPGSFSGALSALRTRVSGPDYRYSLPWYLLVGPPESGKTSLLSESSLSTALEEQIRVEQGAGLAWNFFENGIVIDVGGWAFSSAASAVSTWRRLLRLFVNHRPERPLDGVILTLAASDLTGASALTPQGLIELGGAVHQRLRQITQTIGFQLPVYLVLTRCDAIPGFTEFAGELESEELQQIFGWSNPHGCAADFEPEWIDEAINFMRVSLERKQSRIFAIHKPAETRAQMFLFPGALYELIPNLRLVLSKALRFTTNDAPMLRGVYCCGATNVNLHRGPETAKLVPVSKPVAGGPSPAFASAGLSWVPAMLEPWLQSDLQIAFTQDLLLKKIFAEKGLAVPLAHHFAWRDRLRMSLQIASAVTAIILAVGTTLAYRRDARDSANLLPLLSTIRTALQSPPTFATVLDPSNRASARSLIHAMASFETDGFSSVFVPASLFDHINTSISKAMVPAFRVLVLQRFHRRLEARIDFLTDLNRKPLSEMPLPPAESAVPPSLQLERIPEFLQMRSFTDQVTELEHFVDVYNRLSTRGTETPISSIIELDQYLHNESSPVPESEARNPYFEQALREAYWSPLAYTNDVRRQMSFKASQLTTALFSAWIEHNPTRNATEHLAAAVDDLSGPSRHSYGQLVETKSAYDTLASAIADPSLRWTAAEQLSLPPNLASVTTEPASRSLLFQPWLHDWMLDLADEDFRKLAAALDNAETPLTGPLVKAEDNKLLLTDRAQEMQVALENLMVLPFMSAMSTAPSVRVAHISGSNFTWNKSSLDAAGALPVSYSRYLTEDLDQAPSAMRSVFSRIAADQLANSLVLAIDEAEQPAAMAGTGSGISGVAEQAQAFAAVEDSIGALLATLQQNNLSLPYEQLRRASTTQAATLLAALDREMAAAPPFGVSTVAISRWTGESSPTGAIFDAPDPDSIAAYLSAQSELVDSYSAIAAPLAGFLRQYSSGLSPASAKVLARWQGITEAVAQHKTKHPGNSIQLVEDFIGAGADKITPAKGCLSAKAPMSASRVADYFTLAATELRRDIVARCQALLSESFVRNYGLLFIRFNRDLAGRFPFASANSSIMDEADPQQVTATFTQRDIVADVLAPPASTGDEVQIFLNELEQARSWFSPLLTTASANQPPALDFIPSFRVDREREVGGNQIIEWGLQVGGDIFHAGDAERKGHWTYGEPIVLSFRWAKNAPFQPSGMAPAHPGYEVQVIGDTVTYTFKDAWSLLRLVRCFAPPAYQSSSPNAFTLAFDIPESAATGAKLQPAVVTSARVFLRLLVSSPGEKQPIRTTTFPQLAPALTAQQKATGE